MPEIKLGMQISFNFLSFVFKKIAKTTAEVAKVQACLLYTSRTRRVLRRGGTCGARCAELDLARDWGERASGPVSYTHLNWLRIDRGQYVSSPDRRDSGGGSGCSLRYHPGESKEPVSYTHLDVYKSQSLSCCVGRKNQPLSIPTKALCIPQKRTTNWFRTATLSAPCRGQVNQRTIPSMRL